MRSFASFLGTTFLFLPAYSTSSNWVSTLQIRTTMLTIHNISEISTWVGYLYSYSSELSPTMWMLISRSDKRICRLALGVTMDCDLTCMPHFRLREHHSEWLGTVQEQSICFAFFHYRIHQLLQLILGICNNYCIICIPKVVDHMPSHLDSSISSMLRMIISVYKTNRCGDATHPCRTHCLILFDSLISPLCLTAACWFQCRFPSSLTSCGSMSRDCSNSISGSCVTVSNALL